MDKMPHIAIIILNWNGREDTIACLKSVLKVNYPNFSVFLVDNASTEKDLEAIKKACPKTDISISFLQNDRNLGFSGGNNVGMKQALNQGADLIFTLNNDTEVDPEILNEAVKAWRLYPKRKVGIIATKMINFRHRHQLDNVGHDLLSTGDTVPHGRGQNTSSFNISRFTMGACAGAAFYSAEMLKEIELFDEDFFLNYEDSDLSLRGIIRGWDCLYAPKTIVFHKINASIKKIKDTSYRIRSQRNQLWAYLHNIPLPVILLNLPWIILRELLVLSLSIVSFRWTVTKIFVSSRWALITSFPLILKKRRRVLKHQKRSSWWVWQQQRSWFSVYWEYFQRIVIKREKSVMG